MPLNIATVGEQPLNLALLTFKQYSQQKSEEQSKLQEKEVFPPEFSKLLAEYPEVQRINFKKDPSHGVIPV